MKQEEKKVIILKMYIFSVQYEAKNMLLYVFHFLYSANLGLVSIQSNRRLTFRVATLFRASNLRNQTSPIKYIWLRWHFGGIGSF